jgi:hypothetical protein
MNLSSRENVVSSFTIIKGAMIEETYATFAGWDFGQSKRENLDRLRADNFIGARSSNWVRDLAKVLNRRFQPDGRDRPLVLLAKYGLSIDDWKPLLLWHMTRDEFLLGDFLKNFLFEAYGTGTYHIRSEDVEAYLQSIAARGAITEHVWSTQTTNRVVAGLLKIAVDFGFLKGSVSKELTSYHLSDRSFLYLLHAINDEAGNPSKAVASTDWRLFLMRPQDVERELMRLHQFKELQYEVAGSLIQLHLPCATASDYAERMVA